MNVGLSSIWQAARDLWRGEPHASDLAMQAEHRVARSRVALIGTLTVLGLGVLVADPSNAEYRQSAPVNLACLAGALVVLVLTRRGTRPAGLALATSIGDVSVVSFLHVVDLLQGHVSVAVNGRVTFLGYFLALLGTCVRWDRRVPLITGAIAAAQYTVIVVWSAAAWATAPSADIVAHGGFDAGVQVERVITLLLFAAICSSIADWTLQLRSNATRDALTGLLNRRTFEERLHYELLRAQRTQEPVSVVMIDIDHFKHVNDVHGHEAGDIALRTVAHLIRDSVRRTDVVGRWGGEEFALVFPNTGAEDVFVNVERLRRLLAAHVIALPRGSELHLTISGGIALAPEDGADASALTHAADARLLAAKRAGRNLIVSVGTA
ncbi:MAG: GGDEF domain-containing protein [Vicinamibacterales bacterium]